MKSIDCFRTAGAAFYSQGGWSMQATDDAIQHGQTLVQHKLQLHATLLQSVHNIHCSMETIHLRQDQQKSVSNLAMGSYGFRKCIPDRTDSIVTTKVFPSSLCPQTP